MTGVMITIIKMIMTVIAIVIMIGFGIVMIMTVIAIVIMIGFGIVIV